MANLQEWKKDQLFDWPPDDWDKWKTDVNSVAQLLISLLNIALQALDLIKAFTIPYIDSISALIDALIQEINSYINDLQKIGLYMTHDIQEPYNEFPFTQLKGGYQAYEKRMVARLTDWRDPNRPDVSVNMKTLAVFFYLSVDPTGVQRLLKLVQMFLNLFQFGGTGAGLPQPVNLDVGYGTDKANLFSIAPLFSTLGSNVFSPNPPNVANLSWQISTSRTYPSPLEAITPPVDGFLVEVSTLPGGIRIEYDRPIMYAPGLEPTDAGGQVKQREQGLVLTPDGKSPLVLWGGADQLRLDKAIYYNSSVTSATKRIYGVGSDSNPEKQRIPLELLRDGDTHYLQKTFLVGQLTSVFSPGGRFSLAISQDELPNDATFTDNGSWIVRKDLGKAATYYVRIVACDDLIENSADTPQDDSFGYRFRFQRSSIPDSGPVLATMDSVQVETDDGDTIHQQVSYGSVGERSVTLPIVFPGEVSALYLQSLELAIAMLLLTRPDLVTYPYTGLDGISQENGDPDKILTGELRNPVVNYDLGRGPLGLEPFAKNLSAYLGVDDFKQIYGASADKLNYIGFRDLIQSRSRVMARQIFNAAKVPGSVQKKVVESTVTLRTAKMLDEVGPLSGLLASRSPAFGLAPNIAQAISLMGGQMSNLGQYVDLGEMGSSSQTVHYSGSPTEMRPMPGLNFPITTTEDAKAKLLDEQAKQTGKFVEWRQFTNPENGEQYIQLFCESVVDRPLGPIFSAQNSPVVYHKGSQFIYYARSFFSAEMYTEAALVLNVATAAMDQLGHGEWEEPKLLFPAMPGLEDFFKAIRNWLEAIQAGIQSIANAIEEYINFIQARIIELQLFIQKINNLIQALMLMDVPTGYVLILSSNGTDGVLTDFQGAAEKPLDSNASYGAGALAVIPLIPSMTGGGLAALLSEIFGG